MVPGACQSGGDVMLSGSVDPLQHQYSTFWVGSYWTFGMMNILKVIFISRHTRSKINYIANGILPACQIGELRLWQHKNRLSYSGFVYLLLTALQRFVSPLISESNSIKEADRRKQLQLLSRCGSTLRETQSADKHTSYKRSCKKDKRGWFSRVGSMEHGNETVMFLEASTKLCCRSKWQTAAGSFRPDVMLILIVTVMINYSD